MIRTRLTNKIFIAATIIASIFTLFFGIYEYRREHAFRVDILHSQLQLNNYRVASRLSSQDGSGGTFGLIYTGPDYFRGQICRYDDFIRQSGEGGNGSDGSGGSKPKVQGGYLRGLLNYSDRF